MPINYYGKKYKMREEKYSNFNAEFGRAMVILPFIGIYGIYSLYQFSKGDKKHIQVLAGFLGSAILIQQRKKKK